MTEYAPDTIIRVKHTGEFMRIHKRCKCGTAQTPVHYEAWREGKSGELEITIVDHRDIELECLPKDKSE